MRKENFQGNVYIFVPCYFKSGVNFFEKACFEDSTTLLKELEERDVYELKSYVSEDIKRCFLGVTDLQINDPDEDAESIHNSCDIYLKTHTTGLTVLMISLANFNGNVTHILDQASREQLQVVDNFTYLTIEHFILKKFGLIKADSCKVCLSVKNKVKPMNELFPYLFASETFLSRNMNTSIKNEPYSSLKNIAEYNSSDIYCLNNTILRIDKRDDTNIIPQENSDATLLFVIEAVCLRFAAIGQSNKLTLLKIKEDRVDLDELYELNESYGRTMAFWDFSFFRYFTAKNLAINICNGLGCEGLIEAHDKNQQFLDYKVNIKRAINDEFENRVVNSIAVIVFIFASVPVIYKTFLSYYNAFEITINDIFASLGAASSTLLMIILIIKLIRSRKGH